LNAWKGAEELVGSSVQVKGGEQWQQSNEKKYYYSRPGAVNDPAIGDGRVTFQYIPDGPVTVLALQVEGSHGRDTFAPYRLVSRGLCGSASAEEVKQKLIEESKLSTEELAARSSWGSIFCCICSLVNMFFASFAYPQIFNAWDGARSKAECFSDLRASATLMKWIFRIVGWLMLYFGLVKLFQPLIMVLAIIPFLAHVGSFFVDMFCGVVSLTISCVIVCCAYMAYHPVYAIIRLGIVAAIAFVVNYKLLSTADADKQD